MNQSENRICSQEFWHFFADVKTSLTNLTNGSYAWKNKFWFTWLGLRTKKGRGIGTSVELGQSSSATSAKESLNPPPERLQYYYVSSVKCLEIFWQETVLHASTVKCLCHPFTTPGPWGKHKVPGYDKYGKVSINSTLKWQHVVKGCLTLIDDSLRQKFTLPPLVISRRPPTKQWYRKIYWYFICSYPDLAWVIL